MQSLSTLGLKQLTRVIYAKIRLDVHLFFACGSWLIFLLHCISDFVKVHVRCSQHNISTIRHFDVCRKKKHIVTYSLSAGSIILKLPHFNCVEIYFAVYVLWWFLQCGLVATVDGTISSDLTISHKSIKKIDNKSTRKWPAWAATAKFGRVSPAQPWNVWLQTWPRASLFQEEQSSSVQHSSGWDLKSWVRLS